MKNLIKLVFYSSLILFFAGCTWISENKKLNIVSQSLLESGAQAPMGMVSVNPKINLQSGNSILTGFSHTSRVKEGIDFLLLPALGSADITKSVSNQDFIKDFYVNLRDDVTSRKPGFISLLTNNEVEMKISAQEKTAMYQIAFPAESNKLIIFNSITGESSDTSQVTYLIQENMNTLLGYSASNANPDKMPVFFAIRFSQPFSSMFTRNASSWSFKADSAYTGHDLLALFTFNKETDTVKMKVGFSTSSIEGAVASMKSIMGWNFKAQMDSSLNFWENTLLKACSDAKSDEEIEQQCNDAYKLLTQFPLLSDDYEEFWFHSGMVMKSTGFKKYDVSSYQAKVTEKDTQILSKYPDYLTNLKLSLLDQEIGNDVLMNWVEQNGHLPDLEEMKGIKN